MAILVPHSKIRLFLSTLESDRIYLLNIYAPTIKLFSLMGSKLEKHLVEGTGSREDSGCHNDEDNGHDVELAACFFSLGFVKHN